MKACVHIERVTVRHNRIEIQGWALTRRGVLQSACAKQMPDTRLMVASYERDRDDVAEVNRGFKKARKSGFLLAWRPPVMLQNISLQFRFSDGTRVELAATPKLKQQLIRRTTLNLLYHHPKALKPLKQRVRDLATGQRRTLRSGSMANVPGISGDLFDSLPKADIVLPVYGRMDYLQKLLPKLIADPHVGQLVIVDDASPDPILRRYLEHQAETSPRINLIRNSDNLGFVASANIGLRQCRRDCILLNSDVDLPADWIPRLLDPIRRHPRVASVTPFTNAGTILSAPRICRDNEAYNHLPVDRIDRWFRSVAPPAEPIEIPTGVGFCMALSRTALDEVGELDEETFGRGYGEENDWCLRAAEAGFRHVAAPNLYVLHKHGGSFVSEEKEKLIRKHLTILRERFPAYETAVHDFIRRDPLAPYRQLAMLRVEAHESASTVRLWLDHTRGGGAQLYRQLRLERSEPSKNLDLVLSWCEERKQYRLTYRSVVDSSEVEALATPSFQTVARVLESLEIDELHVNNLVFFPAPERMTDWATAFLRLNPHVRSTCYLHDYHPVCPSHNLIDRSGNFCGVPDLAHCRSCLRRNPHVVREESQEIDPGTWRKHWHELFEEIDAIRAFSSESVSLLLETFAEARYKISLVPHEPLFRASSLPEDQFGSDLVVGVLGNIGVAKGARVVGRLSQESDVPIVLAGKLDASIPRSDSLRVLGPYRHKELRSIVRHNRITIGFVPSIWPETYNFVSDELMALGLPVVCFDIGAHAQRIRRYEKGHVLDLALADDPAKLGRALAEIHGHYRSVTTEQPSFQSA